MLYGVIIIVLYYYTKLCTIYAYIYLYIYTYVLYILIRVVLNETKIHNSIIDDFLEITVEYNFLQFTGFYFIIFTVRI